MTFSDGISDVQVFLKKSNTATQKFPGRFLHWKLERFLKKKNLDPKIKKKNWIRIRNFIDPLLGYVAARTVQYIKFLFLNRERKLGAIAFAELPPAE